MPSTCPVCQKTFTHLAIHLKKKKPCVPPPANSLESLQATVATLTTNLQAVEAQLRQVSGAAVPANVIEHVESVGGTGVNEAISLFSGAGGDTLGLERAGFNVVAFNEFNEAATKTHMTVFPKSVMLTNPATGKTDIKQVPDSVFEPHRGRVRLVFAGFPCFVEGTRVLTDQGYMPIETISFDRKLMTHTGTFQPIVNLQRKLCDGPLYELRIKYHPEKLVTTEEHPFYVREQVRKWDNTVRKYTISYKAPQWKSAKELTSHDYFGMVINSKSEIPIRTFTKKINSSRTDTIKLTLNDPDQWFMMGYFIGDGWIEETLKQNGNRPHKIRFAINKDDIDTVLPRLQKVIPITNKMCPTGGCDKYGCADMIWYTILKEFGKYAHGKKIPEWVQDAPTHLIQAFIDGYYAADGCDHEREVRYTTVSYNLALGLQRLYLKLGHIVSIQKSVRPKTCVIEGRTVNQRDTYTVSGVMDRKRPSPSFIEDGYAWMPSFSIKVSTPTEPVPVYNFEVETDNSYIVDNTIVHNCQGFSHAGKKKSDDARNELVHEFARVARIVQPEWILGENVKGLLARKGKDPEQPADAPLRPVIDIIRDLFERTGYKITYKVIDVTTIGVPQHRKRLIIVGHRGTQYPHMPWEALTEASTPVQPAIRPFLESHLTDAMELPALYTPHTQPAHYWIPTTATAATGVPHPNLARLVQGIRNPSSKEKLATPPPPPQIVEPAGLISFGVRKSGYHGMIVDPDKACNTIISTYNLCPRLFVGLHNATTNKYWIRCMTPKELGQIQGFPANYAWQGTEKAQIAQIGNAVPPPLAERIARTLDRVVFKTIPQVTEAATDDSDDESND